MDNRLALYIKIRIHETVLEEFEKIHAGVTLPSDIQGFHVNPMINLYKGVYRDKIRNVKPKEPSLYYMEL